jgi:four helix bundle protein
MRNPRSLLVWTKARALVAGTYRITAAFPPTERFGLSLQMRRAAVSIGSNISEGAGRFTNREFAATLQHAMAEASELEFQIVIAQDLQLADAAQLESLERDLIEVKKMLSALILKVRAANRP